MSNQDLQQILAAINQVRAANTASPEAARQFLKDEGFLANDGTVAQPYALLFDNNSQS